MPDAGIQLDAYLHHALGPAPLLRLEGVNLHGNFRRSFFIQKVNELPAHQLRAETEIGVLGKGVMLPATAHVNRGAPPDAGRAVEIEEAAGAIARRLLDNEMSVQHDRLQASQQVVL